MSDRVSDSQLPVERMAGIVAVVGTWIFWSGVFVTGTGWIVTLNVFLGGAIATIGAYTAAWPSDGPLPVPSVAAPMVAFVLGLVVIALPFLLGVGYELLVWSNVGAGAVVAFMSGVSVYGSWQLTGATTRA